MPQSEYDDTSTPWKARLDRQSKEQVRRHEAWAKSAAGQKAAEQKQARSQSEAEAARRRAEIREPGTYPVDIDGQPAYEMVCHCGTVNTVFAHRVNFDQHQTCQGCRGLFLPEAPKASEGEQLFRDLARDLNKPPRSG
jgi:hypothetical protein